MRRGAAGRRLLALELVPTALLAAAVARGLWGFSYDDAFITYRYADNWAAGRGLVFNPGEAVLGTSAPGWALLLGALARASAALGIGTVGPGGTAVPGWGTLLTVAALWWLTAALPALWLPAGSRLRPALPLLLGTLALTCRWNLELLGAEAFPAAALAATAAWLALGGRSRGRAGRAGGRGDATGTGARGPGSGGADAKTITAVDNPAAGCEVAAAAAPAPETFVVTQADEPASRREAAAGLVAAAAMLCRLDAALAAGVIGVALWIHRRRLPWRFAVAGLAPLVPYLLWLHARFGTVMPATLAGKRGEASFAALGYGAAEWAWLGRAFGGFGRAALIALAAAGAAWLLGRTLATRRRGSRPPAGGDDAGPLVAALGRGNTAVPFPGALAVLAAWLVLHETFYRAAGVPFAPWYQVAGLDALLALAATAAGALGAALAGAPPTAARFSANARRAAGGLLAALVALPVLLPGARFLATTWGEPPDIRIRLYAAVGRHLREHAPPDARVASMEVGALACASDRPVLDLVGLVSPEVLRARAAGRLPEHVAEAAPEYILVPPPFLGRELGDVMHHPEIRARYRPAARFFDPAYEHDPVTLYRRREPGAGREVTPGR